MTYIIAEPCIDIKDRSCVDVCPVDCIHEAERILVIDPEECIDCGACEPECPVEAIFPEDALPDKWEPFVKINYAYGEGFDVVNNLTNEYATEHNVQNPPLTRRNPARVRGIRPSNTKGCVDAAAGLEQEARAPVQAHQGERQGARRVRGKAEEIAARTVNKERARAGEAKTSSRLSRTDISSGRRGGIRSGTKRPKGRTKEQLYNEAKRMGIEGRSRMTKQQLQRAVDRRK